jgi:hypothetical protein
LNHPIAIAGSLTLLAFVAHITGGIKQSLSIAPSKVAGSHIEGGALETLDRNWVQAMCAFQLVTVDLLALSGVLFFTGFHQHACTKAGNCLRAFSDLLPVGLLLADSTARSEAKAERLPFPWSLGFLVSLFGSHFLGGSVTMKSMQALTTACRQMPDPSIARTCSGKPSQASRVKC